VLACCVGIIDAVTVTDAPSTTSETLQTKPSVVSGTSPLAAGFRSRFFTEDDYRRFHARAPRYDSENTFFAEDFAELVDAGYLKAPLPQRLGGFDLSLTELAREQRDLAYWAPATALAINMHLYWAGSASDAAARGFADVDWLLNDIAEGIVRSEPEYAKYRAVLDWAWSYSARARSATDMAAQRAVKLERMRALLAALGNPERGFPAILVAGTKGKGSTVAMLSACLSAAGLRTGRYTSPHLVNWRERTCIDGQPISVDDVIAMAEPVRRAVEELPDAFGAPTTFEVGTAITLLYFAQASLEVAVVEVGTGGRFDATNLVEPLVSVVPLVPVVPLPLPPEPARSVLSNRTAPPQPWMAAPASVATVMRNRTMWIHTVPWDLTGGTILGTAGAGSALETGWELQPLLTGFWKPFTRRSHKGMPKKFIRDSFRTAPS